MQLPGTGDKFKPFEQGIPVSPFTKPLGEGVVDVVDKVGAGVGAAVVDAVVVDLVELGVTIVVVVVVVVVVPAPPVSAQFTYFFFTIHY